MAEFDTFFKQLQDEIVDFANYSWRSYEAAAAQDGKQFVSELRTDLQRWTQLLEVGALTREDFEWLVVGKKDLAELVALKRIGLAKVALDRFINGLIDTVVSTAFKVFL